MPALNAGFELHGHRGARGLRPENTVPSFLEAMRWGVDALELDLVVTGDGHLLVSHEPWFAAETSTTPDGEPVGADDAETHNIYRLSLDAVRRYDCGARGHRDFPQQVAMPACKPTLAEVVAAVDAFADAQGLRRPQLNLEVKSKPGWEGLYQPPVAELVDLVLGEVRRLGLVGRVLVQSFDPRVVALLQRRAPELSLGFLVENDNGVAFNLSFFATPPDYLNVDYTLITEAMVQEVHRRGLRLLAWTVNEVDAMVRLRALGVDGLITDYPDRAARLRPHPAEAEPDTTGTGQIDGGRRGANANAR